MIINNFPCFYKRGMHLNSDPLSQCFLLPFLQIQLQEFWASFAHLETEMFGASSSQSSSSSDWMKSIDP